MIQRTGGLLGVLLCALWSVTTATSLVPQAAAQQAAAPEPVAPNGDPAGGAAGLDFLNQLQGFPTGPGAEPAEFSAQFQAQQGGGQGKLMVTVKLAPNWHVYSVTQPEGGPGRSKLQVARSDDYEVVGPFTPDTPPIIHEPDVFPVRTEEHADEVTWTAPLRFREGVELESLVIEVTFNGQVCETMGSCIPIDDKRMEAKFAGFYEPQAAAGQQAAAGEFREADSRMALRGHVEPQTVTPGGMLQITLTAIPDEGWHVYALGERDEGKISKPTLIVLRSPDWTAEPPIASSPPVEKETGLPEEPISLYHEQAVTWTVTVQVPEDAQPGSQTLEGIIGYQVCSQSSCDPMTAAEFQAVVQIGAESQAGQVPLEFRVAKYGTAAKLAEQRPAPGATAARGDASQSGFHGLPLVVVLGAAFLAGLILNVMPCVLPVIGLKIMSFVQQAGQEHRLGIFWLNVWFSLGLLTVFWALATVSVVLSMLGRETIGWGEQFAYAPFSITLLSLVFVFALSFLGVWEVPIPGFVGSSKTAHQMAQRGGAPGAFAKGVLATLLATPCSGPLLVPAIGWAVVQPVVITYTAFTAIGLGMAFPYLLIGAFPRLINLLPKPGAWMETFKQLMGFLLLGTVVWIFYFLDKSYTTGTLALLVALGFACWVVGRVPITAETSTRVKAWATAVGAVALTAVAAFVEGPYVIPGVAIAAGLGLATLAVLSAPAGASAVQRGVRWAAAATAMLIGLAIAALSLQSAELAWEPYSTVALREHLEEGNTVLVDFTADW